MEQEKRKVHESYDVTPSQSSPALFKAEVTFTFISQ